MQQHPYQNLPSQVQSQIQKHYQSIIQFKKNKMKTDFVLNYTETQQQQKQQLRQIKQKIQHALKQQELTLKSLQKIYHLYPLSQQILSISDTGALTKCFIKQQRKWKNAQVLEVDVEEQTAKIKRYGHYQPTIFPAYYLKVLKLPDSSLFTEGAHCKAIYSEDGQFYPCIIQKIDEEGYHVRYKKYNIKQVVSLNRLRLVIKKPQKQQSQQFPQAKLTLSKQLKIPQNLKILPNDSDNIKKSKKIKIKSLKFFYKNQIEQQINLDKKNKWIQFNQNYSKNKFAKNKLYKANFDKQDQQNNRKY